jgi:5'-phosphate synthase pdxT subunit
VREVRETADLQGLAGLVLPGGESTTQLKLMEKNGFEEAIRAFHRGGGALFGTCAGLILLATGVREPAQRSLGLLDLDVVRNGFGRQIDSFEAEIPWDEGDPLPGLFIRAPRISRVGQGVTVLARWQQEPVLVRSGRILAATFHPELTHQDRVHRYFLEDVLSPGAVHQESPPAPSELPATR